MLLSELGHFYSLTIFHGRLMCCNTRCCPLGTNNGVDDWLTPLEDTGHKFMYEVRMGSPMATSLHKLKMVSVLKDRRLGEATKLRRK